MLSIEIKVDGQIAMHICSESKGLCSIDCCQHEYSLYNAHAKTVSTGKVIHKRNNGIAQLIAKILSNE